MKEKENTQRFTACGILTTFVNIDYVDSIYMMPLWVGSIKKMRIHTSAIHAMFLFTTHRY